MTRLINIKETLEIPGVGGYTIARTKGSVGLNFTLVKPSIYLGHDVGDPITIKGVDGIVTSKEYNAAPAGYETVISGVSKIGEAINKSPVKTLMYMSMDADEIEEFKIACEEDYDHLNYIPLIKQCDAKTGTGGWCSNDVIADLFKRAGIPYRLNVYNYWLKQVQASNSSTYFDTIMSIVSFLRPIVYSDEEMIFILDRPHRGGGVEISKTVQATQRQTLSYEGKAKYFSVTGGYGPWDRNRSPIPAEPEREFILRSESYHEKPLLMTMNLSGLSVTEKTVKNTTQETQIFKDYYNTEIIVQPGETKTYRIADASLIWKIDGRIGSETSPNLVINTWLKESMGEKHTTTEVIRLDPFGNPKALLSKHEVIENLMIGEKTLDCLEERFYDFLGEEFDCPREKARKVTEGKWTWEVGLGGGLASRRFKGKTDITHTTFIYSANGTLLQQVSTKETDVVRLMAGNEYVELALADSMWIPEGQEELYVERQVVEEEVISYRQITPKIYEKSTTLRRLGALARQKGQENFVTGTDTVDGRVPRRPMRYRKMIIQVDNIPKDAIPRTHEVPTICVSNPNIIDWDDAEAILRRIMQLATESNVVERTLVVPKDIEIDVGWQMTMPAVKVGKGAEIPAFDVPNYCYVTSWQKAKEARSPTVTTMITIEAR